MQSKKAFRDTKIESWADVWTIYKIRFKTLGRALALNLLAGGLIIGLMFAVPFVSGITALTGHIWIAVIMAVVGIGVPLFVYVRSFKIVLGLK